MDDGRQNATRSAGMGAAADASDARLDFIAHAFGASSRAWALDALLERSGFTWYARVTQSFDVSPRVRASLARANARMNANARTDDDERRTVSRESDAEGRVVEMPKTFGGRERVDARASASGKREVEVVDLASPAEREEDERAGGESSESDVPPLSERLMGRYAIDARSNDRANANANANATTTTTTNAAAAAKEAAATTTRRRTEIDRDDALTSWIMATDDVYERILLMDSIDVDDALERARRDGVRCGRADFSTYLRAQGACFSHTSTRRRRARATSTMKT